MTELPSGWTETTLGEIADTSLGKMLDRGQGTGRHLRPYLRNVNVQWGRIDQVDVLTMDVPPDQEERFRVRDGDLLVCEGGEIGRCAIWRGGDEYMAFQKALHRVRPLGCMDPQYLRYVLEYLTSRGVLASWATGSTIKHLPQEQLRQLPIPLPPLAEQRRIVNALEDALFSLDAGVANLAGSSARLDSLSRALMKTLLGSSLLDQRKLGALLTEKMINGRSVPTQAGGFPVLRLTALRGDEIDLSERKSGAWSLGEARQYLVHRGDFLVSRGNGSLRLVGRGGLVSQDPDPVAFPDTLIRVRVDKSAIRPEFLALVWNSPHVRHQIERSARTTAGIYKVNQAILSDVAIPVPKLDEQDRIIARWQAAAEETQRLRAALLTASKRAAQLRTSLLSTAFVGRLVPQNPNDEPASDLLARIRAERAAAPPKQKRRPPLNKRELAAPPTRVTGDNYQQEALPL